jgi:hypothetical protein
MTWNPGLEGDQDRPSSAPLSRITPLKLDPPTEKERIARLGSFFDAFEDTPDQASQFGSPASHADILKRDYQVPDTVRPSEAEMTATVRFTQEIKDLVVNGGSGVRVGMTSRSPAFPGDREASRFALIGKTCGWDEALETMKVYCDQSDEEGGFQEQWDLIQAAYQRHIGDALDADGRSLKPPPAMS